MSPAPGQHEEPTIDLPSPVSALAIGAHPDDVELGCGATLAKWADTGTDVQLLVLTDGSKGSWDPATDGLELAERRRAEQRAAADELGIGAVHFLDAVDGELDHGPEMRARVCSVIRAARPAIVLGHDPWKRYRLHPDHVHAGQLTIDGIVAARDPHFFPGAGTPHRPERLLLFEAEVVDHVEDVSGTMDRKVAALLAHRSQWHSTMGIDAESPEAATQRAAFIRRLADEAASAGAPAGLARAEAFKLLRDL
jgi:LmbE family N-acetylglucosaminyl deacetylase